MNTKRTFHLAVLENDTVVDSISAKCGSYGDIYERFISSGLKSLGINRSQIELKVSKWDVVTAQEYPNLAEVDGILLSGSKHDAHANEPWKMKLMSFLRQVVYSTTIPIIAICFGHQILARTMGAKVGRGAYGWEVSVGNIELTDIGQRIFGKSYLTIQQTHRDNVLEVPEGLQNLGFSPKCEVQGLYMPYRIISLQSHPEFDAFHMKEILKAKFSMGLFSEEEYAAGMLRVNLEHDGKAVSRVFCKFLLGYNVEEAAAFGMTHGNGHVEERVRL